MDCDPTEVFDVYMLSTARRIHAMNELARRALEYLIDVAVKHAQRCLEHDAHLLVKEQQRRGKTRAAYGPHARKFDVLLGHCMAGFYSYLENQVRIFSAASERGQAAAFVKGKLFPAGVKPVTDLSYIEQHAEVQVVVQRAQTPEIAAALAKLPDAPAMLERIRELNQEHGRSLDEYQRIPSYQEVREDHAYGHALMVETMILVYAHFITHAPHDHEGRDYVLEPLMRQNELVRQARRRKRAPDDPEGMDVEPGPAGDTEASASAKEPPGDSADPTSSGEFPAV